jgi:hypothetical protein
MIFELNSNRATYKENFGCLGITYLVLGGYFFEFLTPSILGGYNFFNSITFLMIFSVQDVQ